VPIVGGGRLFGVIFAESGEDTRFGYDEGRRAGDGGGTARSRFHGDASRGLWRRDAPNAQTLTATAFRAARVIRHYAGDESVFIDDDYLIKGVAGAIFWKLVREYAAGRRSEFTNKELRWDAGLRLPALSEKLEARLILLERRLAERCTFIAHRKDRRGRFRLAVRRPVKLVEMPGGRRVSRYGHSVVTPPWRSWPIAVVSLRQLAVAQPLASASVRMPQTLAAAGWSAWRSRQRAFFGRKHRQHPAAGKLLLLRRKRATMACSIANEFGVAVCAPEHLVVFRLFDIHVDEVLADKERELPVQERGGGGARRALRLFDAQHAASSSSNQC
jgi:hypothetical protein